MATAYKGGTSCIPAGDTIADRLGPPYTALSRGAPSLPFPSACIYSLRTVFSAMSAIGLGAAIGGSKAVVGEIYPQTA